MWGRVWGPPCLFLSKKRVAQLCGRETRMPGGRLGSSPFWPPRSLSARTAGTGVKGTGKGAQGPAMPEVPGNHLPSSHLVAMMPKTKTTAAKTPIMAALRRAAMLSPNIMEARRPSFT